MEVVDKESMKRISEVMLAATVSVEEASGALKEIALSWSSAEYNSKERQKADDFFSRN